MHIPDKQKDTKKLVRWFAARWAVINTEN